MKKNVVPKLRQEVKVDIVTGDDVKIYYTEKFQDFTARYIIKKRLSKGSKKWGKKRKCWVLNFLLFRQCFQWDLLQGC